jgi:hypothetical protein
MLEHIFPLGDFSLDMALFTNFAIAFAASDCNASSLSRRVDAINGWMIGLSFCGSR